MIEKEKKKVLTSYNGENKREAIKIPKTVVLVEGSGSGSKGGVVRGVGTTT